MAASPEPSQPDPGIRLTSWKEIATYLNRDVRTLQRWEKNEGLPVHRHLHDFRSSVYAYEHELDAWLAGRTLTNGNGNGNGAEAKPLWYRRSGWAAGALAIVSVGAIYFAVRSSRASVLPPAPAFRQVLDSADTDFTVAVSRDGRYVFFTDVVGLGINNLGIWDLTTRERRVLTHRDQNSPGCGWIYYAVFSPDAKSIVYTCVPQGMRFELHRMGVDGAGDRTILKEREGRDFTLMDWSRDGKYIAAVMGASNQETQLGLISPEDGSVRVLKRFGAVGIQHAAFSTDGRYLAYDAPASRPGSGSDIFLISTDGKEERPLIEHPADEFLLGWSPQGDSLIFASTRTGTWGVWQAAFTNGTIQDEPKLLKEDVGRVLPVSIASNGSVFLLLSVGLADVYTAELGSPAPPVRISENPIGLNQRPSFSPDGRSLLYHSSRGAAGGTLRIRSLVSGRERETRPKLNSFQSPGWIEGGRAIQVNGTDGATVGAWRVDPETGNATLVRAGRAPPVYKPPEGSPGPGDPTPSPDGSLIARAVRGYPKGYNSLMLVPAAGGPARELVRLKQPEGFTGAFAWSPEGRYMYFTRHNNAGTELMRVPAAGGPMEPAGIRMSMIRSVSIHSDGKRVAFAGGESNVELWALEGFLSR